MAETLQWIKRLNQEKVDSVYLKAFGQRYLDYRNLWKKAGKDFLPDFPVHLDFELIDACNLRCRHCFRNKEIADKLGIVTNTGARFPLKLFEQIITDGVKNGLQAINLGFSGESLLNPDLSEMIDVAHQAGVLDIRLFTNGSLLSEESADGLVKSALTFLSFSVDAGTAETYRLLKGKDYFARLGSIVKYAYRRKIELNKDFPLIRASFYPCPENHEEQDVFVERFKDDVDFIDFQTFHNFYETNKPDWRQVKISCRAPFQRLAIFPNGDVSPCCTAFNKKLIVGNVNQTPLKEIWKSEKIKRVREGLIKKEPLPPCRKCLEILAPE